MSRPRSGTEAFRVMGRRMLAGYHRPAGAESRRFPAVLFLHGFPGAEKSVDLQRALMARGIASVAPSFLGAWGSGGRYRFTTLVAQARAALAQARRLPFVDPRRTAVFGFSMGGWAAINLAAEDSSLRGVAAAAPCGGPEVVGPRTDEFVESLSAPLNAPPTRVLAADFRRALERFDPAKAVARLRAPLLLVHGDADEVIPVAVSRRLKALAGARARLAVFPGASHDFLEERPRLVRLASSWLAARLAALLLAAALPAAAQGPEDDLVLSLQSLRSSVAEAVPGQRRLAGVDAPSPEQARAMVKRHLAGSGVPEAYVDAAFDDPRSVLYPDIPGRFDGPSGPVPPTPYERYRLNFITPANAAAGAAFMDERADLLDAAAARYGVDGALLTALVSVETRYGTNVGRYSVLDALVTIVLGVPRRSDWAAREAAEFLRMTHAQGMDPHGVAGSYAGAFGYVQFMPSTYNALAVDFDGDGSRRLDQWPDALASAANYLVRAGYDPAAPFTPDSAIGRSLFAYNRSRNYVRVILELREEILRRRAPGI